MNKYELAKEIELQEELLQQLKKEYIEKSKPNVKVGQCFSKWNFINTVYYKVIGINNDNVRPIKVIRVVKNRNIDIIELYLEEKANDYKLIADNMTRSRAHYLYECESLVDKYNSLMNDYNSLVEKYNAL